MFRSDWMKHWHWRVTHLLEGCSSIFVSGSDLQHLLKHWRETHKLEGCSSILISILTCSNTRKGLTFWMSVHPFSSVVPICPNTGEGLTYWMSIHTSVVLICPNTEEGLTFCMFTCSCQWAQSVQTPGSDSLTGCSPFLISGSDLHKHWRETHILDGCSPILVNGSDLLKYWRGTHLLDGCSYVLIRFWSAQTLERDSLSGWVFTHSCQCSDLLKHWRGTHLLNGCCSCQVPICSNTGEKLTSWMGFHPFLSVVPICSKTGVGLTRWMGCHPFLSGVLIYSNTGEGLTFWIGVHPFSSVVPI